MTASLLKVVVVVAGLVATAGACDEEDALSPADVAGSYTATTFTAGAASVLAAGGSIAITLSANGTTTGQLFVPASVTGSADLTVDLSGTWELIGATVRFDLTADSFVEDLDFDVIGNTLQGSGTFSLTAIAVVLTRT